MVLHDYRYFDWWHNLLMTKERSLHSLKIDLYFHSGLFLHHQFQSAYVLTGGEL